MTLEQQIVYQLGSINIKLDDALKAKVDHEDRITSLEKWRVWLLGAAASVTLIGSAAAWAIK